MTKRYRRKCSSNNVLLGFAFVLSISITCDYTMNKSPIIIPTIASIFTSATTFFCIPYTVPDNRSFFQREPSQLNLPRKLSYSSHQHLLQHLKSLRLYVLATGRNVADNVATFRKHIEPIVDLFHPSSRILICESDSNDNTIEKLYQWPRAQVYTYGNMAQLYPSRPERIAFCRNKLLNLTHQMASDYILMVDVDMFASSVTAFLTNFQYNTDDWSGMTASTQNGYYDIWALRTLSDSNLNYDVWHRVWDILRYSKTYCSQSVTDQIIGIHQKQIPVNHSLIEVRSAFNGAGLYKTHATYGCQYSGANMTCEHVPFHLCMRKKNQGRIFINPAFLLA